MLAGELPLTLLLLEPCLCRILVPLNHWYLSGTDLLYAGVIWRRVKITNDTTMTTLVRARYRCQVFSYQMIQNKAAAGRTENLPETQTIPEILYLPLSIKNTTSSLRCFRLLQDITMLLLNTLKSK